MQVAGRGEGSPESPRGVQWGVPSPTPRHTEPGPPLVDVAINLAKSKDPVRGRLVASRLCMNGKSASFVRHIEIDLSGTRLAGTFTVGQAFGVIPPGTDDRGRPHKVRLYSMACPSWGEDGRGAVVSTTVKRVIDEFRPHSKGDDPDDHSLFLGVCSNWLCDAPLGAEILVTGPAGRSFLLPKDPEKYNFLFVAAGTGIAPFRGMVRELFERPGGPIPGQVALVMGSPYRTDLLYHEYLCGLDDTLPNFDYAQAISREEGPEGPGEYTHHLIHRRIDTYGPLLEQDNTLIYVCGLDGMQIGLYRTLAFHGLAGRYLRMPEEFASLDPNAWPPGRIKRSVKPTKNMFVEVY